MRLEFLELNDFRNIARATLEPAAGVNALFGPNGAGKTSVLEAIHLLATGRSFRENRTAPMIRDGASALRVFCRTLEPAHRLGVERAPGGWTGRLDGQPCTKLSQFARALPVVAVHPENHRLLQGGPDVRRSFLDWGLFHVEPSYLEYWKRYTRLLRQRNAALRDHAADALLASVEEPMARAAARVDDCRARYVARIAAAVETVAGELDFQLPPLALAYRSSQSSSAEYSSHWAASRNSDREQGFTRAGPHRAELVVNARGRLAAPRLSRGQLKLAALLLRLAQVRVTAGLERDPVLLLDDPVSELDARHLDRLLTWIEAQPNQTWLTAVARPARAAALFHVEQGKIGRVV